MKKLLITACLLASATAAIYSCNKKADTPTKTAQHPEPGIMTRATPNTIETHVHCNGMCQTEKCALEGVMDGNDTYIQCKCKECEMEVTVTTSQSGMAPVTDSNTLEDGQVPVYFLQSFGNYMQEEFPGQPYDITDVDITDDQQNNLDNYVITYSYRISNGNIGTITFTWNRQTGVTQKVDCKGTCDCRERYYPGSGAIECTCKDNCSMTITKLAPVPTGAFPM